MRLDDHHNRRGRAARQIVRELADATGHEDPDVRFFVKGSGADGVAAPRIQLLVGQGDRQGNHAGRIAQPPHVPVEKKWLAVVRAPRLVDALAVQKSVIEDGDDSVLLVEHAAVDIDGRCHQFEGSTISSFSGAGASIF